jgi:hypothetical protein
MWQNQGRIDPVWLDYPPTPPKIRIKADKKEHFLAGIH